MERYAGWALLGAAIVLTFWVRLRLAGTPFERDEGGYAYIARMQLRGVPPYVSGYSMHMPGLYLVYALFLKLFGETAEAVRTGYALAIAATSAGVYLLGKRLAGPLTGGAAALIFALLSLGERVQGLFSNSEHLINFFVVAAALLLAGWRREAPAGSRRAATLLWLAGVSLGLAFLMKQVAAVYAAGAAIWAVAATRRESGGQAGIIEDFFRLLAGCALPVMLVFLWQYVAGDFDRFMFWTLVYPLHYGVPDSPGAVQAMLVQGWNYSVRPLLPYWIAGAAGLVWLALRGDSRHGLRWLVPVFAIASLAALLQGFYLRPHYFQLVLPWVALGAGYLASRARLPAKLMPEAPVLAVAVPAAAALLLTAPMLWREGSYLFRLPPEAVSRRSYGMNPFPESLPIAEFIRGITGPADKVAIIGSEPQILFYADRESATGYLYTYALMEPHPFSESMQQEFIRQVEAARPAAWVFVNVPTSWLPRKDSHGLVFGWFEAQLQSGRLESAGVVDLIGPGRTVYRFGEEAKGYRPRSSLWVAIYTSQQPETQETGEGVFP